MAEYRTRFNKQSSFGVVDDERTDGFRTTAANKTTLGVELVLQEAALQNSLETDRARLATKVISAFSATQWLFGEGGGSCLAFCR